MNCEAVCRKFHAIIEAKSRRNDFSFMALVVISSLFVQFFPIVDFQLGDARRPNDSQGRSGRRATGSRATVDLLPRNFA
eukprot:scaffold195766_cov32-Prasinocladus_malaysianus.AAC.2